MNQAEYDGECVDRIAAAMKNKLAVKRQEGRGGWDDPEQCTTESLAEMLLEHLLKGDPVDIANFAMMLHARPGGGNALARVSEVPNRFYRWHPFQRRVAPWLYHCFGSFVAEDTQERNWRFLEESVELVQSLGMGQDEVKALVNYVYDRPKGDPAQEVGGVRVTLAAVCEANGLSEQDCAEAELSRVWEKVDTIREKHKQKPTRESLPDGSNPTRD